MCGAVLLLSAALSVRVSSQAPPAQAAAPAQGTLAGPTYVGSKTCSRCHAATYERWSKTQNGQRRHRSRHSTGRHHSGSSPSRIRCSRSSSTTSPSSTASKWKQRYFTKVGDDYFPLPAQWDVTNRVWRPYFVQPNTDWWVPHYPADNMQRPTGPLCDGCHSVNYDIRPRRSRSGTSAARRAMAPAVEHVAPPVGGQYRQPGEARFRARQRHLHPVPLAGTAAAEPDRGPVLRLAGRLPSGRATQGLLEARRAQARGDDVHALRGRHRPQEPDAGQRLRAERDVPARRHLLQLPRRRMAPRTTRCSSSRRATSA